MNKPVIYACDFEETAEEKAEALHRAIDDYEYYGAMYRGEIPYNEDFSDPDQLFCWLCELEITIDELSEELREEAE